MPDPLPDPAGHRRDILEIAAGIVILVVLFLLVRLAVAPYVISGFFGKPSPAQPSGGAVWSNLVASVVCVGAAWWRIRARMIAHHAQVLAQAKRHHDEQMTQAAVHHADMKEHVTAAARGGVPLPAHTGEAPATTMVAGASPAFPTPSQTPATPR